MEHTYKVTARDGNTYITEGVVALTFADEYWTLYSRQKVTTMVTIFLPLIIFLLLLFV